MERIGYEKERRNCRTRRNYNPMKAASWNSVVEEATGDQIARREMDAFEAIRSCRVHTGDGGIYYTDRNGEFWDEEMHKKHHDEGVRNARLDEINQLYAHRVRETVPAQDCCNATGKKGYR